MLSDNTMRFTCFFVAWGIGRSSKLDVSVCISSLDVLIMKQMIHCPNSLKSNFLILGSHDLNITGPNPEATG
jgi:hypothetical protein